MYDESLNELYIVDFKECEIVTPIGVRNKHEIEFQNHECVYAINNLAIRLPRPLF